MKVDDCQVMTNGEKMAALMRRLKVEINGAVVDAMRERGITYPLSYGVSVPAIRKAAAEYAPDHKFARLLYQQPVRELRLAAVVIADPAAVDVDELGFWAEGVINTEVAEHLGTSLLAKTAIVWDMFAGWLGSGNSLLEYSALLAGARKLALDGGSGWLDRYRTMELIPMAAASPEKYVWQGAVRFLERLAVVSPGAKRDVTELLCKIISAGTESAGYMENELGWTRDI